jgi:hypothetical protein
MDGDDPELEIHIRSSSDVGGIQEAEKSLGGFKETAGEAAGEIRHLTGSSREGEEIFRALGSASRGSATAIGEMVRGLRSLVLVASHLAGEGPLGVLLITIGLIGGAFLTVKNRSEEASKGIKEVGDKSDDLKKHFEELDKTVEATFKPMIDRAKELVAEMEKLDKMQKQFEERENKLNQAKGEVSKSQLELDKQTSIGVAEGASDAATAKSAKSAQRLADLVKGGGSQEDIDRAKAAADADSRAADKASQDAEIQKKHLEDIYEAKVKLQELDEEANKSANEVLSAKTASQRADDLAAEARGNEYSATVAVQRAQQDFEEAKSRATTSNEAALGSAGEAGLRERRVAEGTDEGRVGPIGSAIRAIGARGANVADKDAAKQAADAAEASKVALDKQHQLQTAQTQLDKLHTETTKVSDEAGNKADALQAAQDLDAQKQKQVQIQKDILAQVEAGKAQDAATQASKRLAAAADEAAKALAELSKSKPDESEKPEKKESKGEKEAQDAADNHRTLEAQRQVEKLNTGTAHVKRATEAMSRHADATEALADHAEKAAVVATKGVRDSTLTKRQLVNVGSYNTSP